VEQPSLLSPHLINEGARVSFRRHHGSRFLAIVDSLPVCRFPDPSLACWWPTRSSLLSALSFFGAHRLASRSRKGGSFSDWRVRTASPWPHDGGSAAVSTETLPQPVDFPPPVGPGVCLLRAFYRFGSMTLEMSLKVSPTTSQTVLAPS